MFHLILLCFSLRSCIRKFYCVLKKIVVYQEISLCSEKDCCVPGNFVVFSKRLLCSRKDCCVLEKIVVFSKRLSSSRKDCCVSEQKLSCVLPLWATVPDDRGSDFTEKFLVRLFNSTLNLKLSLTTEQKS